MKSIGGSVGCSGGFQGDCTSVCGSGCEGFCSYTMCTWGVHGGVYRNAVTVVLIPPITSNNVNAF